MTAETMNTDLRETLTGDEQLMKKFLTILKDYNMDKSATYDDISEVIKERVDNFELKDNAIEERLTMESLMQLEKECLSESEVVLLKEMHKFSENYINNYLGKDVKIFRNERELIKINQERKQQKDNHPRGWYRKFEKKRY